MQGKLRQFLSPTTLFIILNIVIVLLLWLPVGFKNTGTVEEWLDMMAWQNNHSLTFMERGRPLYPTLVTLSYSIFPNSFITINLFLAFLLLARAWLCYLLTKLLSQDNLLAIAVGFLSMLFSMDEAHMSIRLTPNHTAIIFLLLAFYLYLKAHEKNQLHLYILGLISLLASLLTYETGFPLAFAFGVYLFFISAKALKERLLAVSVWLGLSSILFINFVYTILFVDTSHQKRMLDLANPSAILNALITLYNTHFLVYWLDIFRTPHSSFNLLLATGIGLIVAALLLWNTYRSSNPERVSTAIKKQSYLSLVALGLIIVFLGFVVFLPSQVRSQSWRVFIISPIGASLSILALLRWLTIYLKKLPWLFPLLATGIIAYASLAAIEQHQHYASESRNMQYIMADVIDEIPQLNDSAQAILIFDKTGSLRSSDVFLDSRRLTAFARAAYDNPTIYALFCAPYAVPSIGNYENCVLSDDGIRFIAFNNGKQIADYFFAYDSLIAFEYDEQLELRLLTEIPSSYSFSPIDTSVYNPYPHICSDCLTTTGTDRLFYTWPFPAELAEISHFNYEPYGIANGQLIYEFYQKLNGIGWSEPLTQAFISYQWMSYPEATINVEFIPSSDQLLSFRLSEAASPAYLDELKVYVNDTPLILSRNDMSFQAEVPLNLIDNSSETWQIRFEIPSIEIPDDAYLPPQFYLAFDRLTLEELH